jgi:hypothetical protein
MKDICHYAPGDLNKIGKEGRTSWDSFSYAILMGHNIYCHVEAVQEGNRQYDAGIVPGMLVEEKTDFKFFRDIVDGIFGAKTRDQAMQLIDEHDRYYMDIIGSSANGFLGKKAKNATTAFEQLFVENSDVPEVHRDDSGIDEKALDQLEETENKD